MFKAHAHISTTDDDTIIGTYLDAARVKVEGFLGRSLINKVYVQTFDHFPRQHHHDGAHHGGERHYDRPVRHLEIKLGRSPLVNVLRIEYLDTSGVLQTMLPRVDAVWQKDTIYIVGNQIVDPNGNIQEVDSGEEQGGGDPNHSGDDEPTWGTGVGDLVDDGEIKWRCKGPAPVGDFIVDTNSEPGRIYPNINTNSYFWPFTQRVPNAVRIYFTAGYGVNPDDVPSHFKTALMIYTKGLYDFRDPLLTTPGAKPTELPSHLRDLLWEDRIKDFAPTEG
jgi:hypothetical protein